MDEVEQVRQALGLDRDNFYLLGHSWGGILATEYALAHQQHLKGLVISNMMMSIPDYNRYASEVLAAGMPPEVVREVREIEKKGEHDEPTLHGAARPRTSTPSTSAGCRSGPTR